MILLLIEGIDNKLLGLVAFCYRTFVVDGTIQASHHFFWHPRVCGTFIGKNGSPWL